MTTSSISSLSSSLVFIDAAVEHRQWLIGGVRPGTTVVVLDSTQDGIEQISQVLRRSNRVESVHIVCHGAPGCLFLGNTQLNLTNLDHYSAQLRQWFSSPPLPSSHALTPSPSLLLYSCQVAAGDAGQELVDRLHQLTGANIAASRSLVGSAVWGGDWSLAVQTGPVADLAFEAAALQRYPAVLATQIDEQTAWYEADEFLKIMGMHVGPPTDGLAVWFLNNGLGTTGGATGQTNGSPGFGIMQAGSYGLSNSVNGGGLLFVNGQAFAAPDVLDSGGGANDLEVKAAFFVTHTDENQHTQLIPWTNEWTPVYVTPRPVEMSGLKVSVQYRFGGTPSPIQRNYMTMENPTATPIAVTISWTTNFAYGNNTQLKADQSGDGTFTVADRWVVHDDAQDAYAGAATAHLFYGSGNPAVKPTSVASSTFESQGQEGVLGDFQVVIPAHSTQALLFFSTNSGSTANAIRDIQLADNAASNGLLGDLTDIQKAQILNWDLGYGITVTPSDSGTTTEAGGQASFSIALKSQPSANVTLQLASSDATEGTVLANSLTFTPANWDQPQTVTVKGVDDEVDDGDVAYKILTSFVSTDSAYAANKPIDLTLINLDDDLPSTPTPTPTPVPTPTPTPPIWVDPPKDPKDPVIIEIPKEPTPTPIDSPRDPSSPTPPAGPANPINLDRVIRGTRRRDILTDGPGNDTLLGQASNDKLVGSTGNDQMVGGTGNDRLLGGNGADVLIGDKGKDTLIGGADQDLFVLARKQGPDHIVDFQNGFDRIGLVGKLSFGSLDMTQNRRNVLIKQGDELLGIVEGIKKGQLTAADFVKVQVS